MFKGISLSLTFVWLILVFAVILILRNFFSDAQVTYMQLTHINNGLKKDQRKDSVLPIQQKREKVTKQMIYQKNLQRLQLRLDSPYSELMWNSTEEKNELVEHFKDLTCIIQEKLLGLPKEGDGNSLSIAEECKQSIRFLKANEAFYSYKTRLLEAESVDMAHYLIPGSICPLSIEMYQPLFQGQALKVQLALFKEPILKTQKFQAIFYQWREFE